MKKKAKAQNSPKKDLSEKKAILDLVLTYVPLEGWTGTSLQLATKKAGLRQDQIRNMYPRGLIDLIEFWGDLNDQAMQSRLDQTPQFKNLRTRDKVAFAVKARFEFLSSHREAVRRLLTWYMLPAHVRYGIRRSMKTVDLIWQKAGDVSTDYNHYTKRILLAAILKSTLFYWLNDKSEGSADTWRFLDQRLADVMRLGKGISLLKELTPSEITSLVRRAFAGQ